MKSPIRESAELAGLIAILAIACTIMGKVAYTLLKGNREAPKYLTVCVRDIVQPHLVVTLNANGGETEFAEVRRICLETHNRLNPEWVRQQAIMRQRGEEALAYE